MIQSNGLVFLRFIILHFVFVRFIILHFRLNLYFFYSYIFFFHYYDPNRLQSPNALTLPLARSRHRRRRSLQGRRTPRLYLRSVRPPPRPHVQTLASAAARSHPDGRAAVAAAVRVRVLRRRRWRRRPSQSQRLLRRHADVPQPPLRGTSPPEELPLTVAAYAFSLLSSAPPLVVAGRGPALVDAATGIAVSYPAFVARVRFLAGGLWCSLGLRPGDVALVVSPSCLDVAVLYFALMSIGVVVSPANPASTADEYAHQVRLSRPAVAFVAPEVAARLPRHVSRVVIGSEVFDRLASASAAGGWAAPPAVAMKQPSTAALLYSSGTTGRVKAVAITHRNLIAQISAYNAIRETVAREAATDAGRASRRRRRRRRRPP